MPLPSYVFDETKNPAVYTAALCSGSAALKALKGANLRVGDVVVVIGIGGQIGYLIGLMAKAVFGARVIGTDMGEKATLSTVVEACDIFIPSRAQQSSENLNALVAAACDKLRESCTHSHGANAVIAAAGSISSFQNLPVFVCDGGIIVLVG